jgi:hypothetical protein
MLDVESEDAGASLGRVLAEEPQALRTGLRLLEANFRLTAELVVDAWMQEPSGRPVVVLGEGSGGEAALIGRAWCAIAEVRRMRNLLERLFRQEGTWFDADPRVIVVARRFSDALLGMRDRLAACAIDLVEATIAAIDGKHHLVVIPAGGAAVAAAPPATDSPPLPPPPPSQQQQQRPTAGPTQTATATVTRPKPAEIVSPAAPAAATSRVNGVGNGLHSSGREPARAPTVGGLLDELKRKVVHLNDHVAEEVEGATTRFRFHGELLAAVTAGEAGLRVAVGEGGELERVVAERASLNGVLDEVVRRYFALAKSTRSTVRQ